MKNIKLPSAETTIIYLAVIYIIGIVGILVEATRPVFIFLVPVNIIGAITITLLYHRKWNKKFVVATFIICIGGFIIEWMGVKTGLIFGQYEYGTGLGPQLDRIPLVMGPNWFLMVYGTSSILSGVAKKKWLISLLGAGLMVVYDIFLEPSAIKLNFWKWADDWVPMQNYLAWFIGAFVFIYLFIVIVKPIIRNPVAEAVFWLQLAFFCCIRIGII